MPLFPCLERVQGVLEEVSRGPVGPLGPLELAAPPLTPAPSAVNRGGSCAGSIVARLRQHQGIRTSCAAMLSRRRHIVCFLPSPLATAVRA
jgi:hypothetical protein